MLKVIVLLTTSVLGWLNYTRRILRVILISSDLTPTILMTCYDGQRTYFPYRLHVLFRQTPFNDALPLSGIVLRIHALLARDGKVGNLVGSLRSGKRVSIFNVARSLCDTAASTDSSY